MQINNGIERWHYAYSGLRITSELHLAEWRAFESAHAFADPDVQIRLELERAAEHSPVITADVYRFHIEEVGDYCVRAGREIVVAMEPNAGARETRLFLLGSAWGALCYQRGILALHMSVVQVGDEAVAFCGPTGAGKSSVAAWLNARGYRLICDDLCCFDFSDGTPRVFPGAPRLKLWRDALAALGRSADGLERDHFRTEKFHTDLTGALPRNPISVPLRAIYLLDWGEPGIARLTGVAALNGLIKSATYRGDLLEPMRQAAAHWQRCARLAQQVPIYKFSRPRDWSAADVSMTILSQHWQNVFDKSKESR
jgi:hypothetical protein